MAEIQLSPMITSISGRMGDVVFYFRLNKQCIRRYVIPRNPNTDSQRLIRNNFSDAIKTWQALTVEEKYKYKRKARNMNMSGYNLFISVYMRTYIPIQKRSVSSVKYSGKRNAIHSGINGNLNQFPSVSLPYINLFGDKSSNIVKILRIT